VAAKEEVDVTTDGVIAMVGGVLADAVVLLGSLRAGDGDCVELEMSTVMRLAPPQLLCFRGS